MPGFVWHSSQKKRAHLKPIKTTAAIYLRSLLVLLPLLSPQDSGVVVPRSHNPPLSSAPCLILNSSFPATQGNKMLLLWKQLTEMRTAAYETSNVETEAYIWSFPVWEGEEFGSSFDENVVSLLCETDEVTDSEG